SSGARRATSPWGLCGIALPPRRPRCRRATRAAPPRKRLASTSKRSRCATACSRGETRRSSLVRHWTSRRWMPRSPAADGRFDWPRSVKARELALRRPWILLERDQSGALPLGALLAPEQAEAAQTPDSAQTSTAPRPSANGSSQPTIPVVLSHLVIEEGGARVVDSGLTPPFAVDIADLAPRLDGLSTAPRARAARIDVKARVGDGQLSFAGTIGPVTGPLRLDLQGELREF